MSEEVGLGRTLQNLRLWSLRDSTLGSGMTTPLGTVPLRQFPVTLKTPPEHSVLYRLGFSPNQI